MLEESFLTTCPNPKCKKKIDEPILVTIKSVSPPKQYDACPYCFTELENESCITNEKMDLNIEEDFETEKTQPETGLAEKTILDDTNSHPKFFNKVKSLIANSEESKEKDQDKKEKNSLDCPENFGYLANRPKESPIPQECLSCPKMVDCMLSPRD